jgi:uncharacterized membrane protein
MTGLGLLMMLFYLHLMFAPWRRFAKAVDGGSESAAAPALNGIRKVVLVNLVLGLVVIVVAATGRYW